ncbi:hypothetical protein CPT_Moabite_170 [Serratia phage Moabite]|uniref:Uncharacterized protein n=3 Tax=Moabitevirus TaxID=2843422 RepID=A0A7T3NBH1_9CAUD|nr:hypothetical protein HWB23_gp089 [Serratia phage vB_SmaM_ 2050HW]YP_009849264.1 hypothetical protein HWC48_gp246 [Serratia phage Moabite]QPX76654.1 hypothetical protein [Serratia phage vB_SmaM_Yaphecito]UCR74699.1 hypothetical protein [Serratia phage BUCT660]UGO54055.1 hypothetical protein HAYMO_73 [Serratia phage vB_SmaM_Haymo]UQT03564.1 hypothetical protein KODAMA_00970 [Serratia phage vB_SmaM-Kodama]URG14267.1 hypothetical protein [Pectobacterium phage vB_ParM-25]
MAKAFNTKALMDDVYAQVDSFMETNPTKADTAEFMERIVKQIMSTLASREEKIKAIADTFSHALAQRQKATGFRGFITRLLSRE